MNKEVGKSTASDRLKRAHRKEYPQLKDIGPERFTSLKSFADDQVKNKTDLAQDAKDWRAAKSGALNLKRDAKTVARISAEKVSKKAGKSKK